MAQFIIRNIILPIIRLFIRRIKGLENLPKEGPYILACKHWCALDGFFIAAAASQRVKQQVHFIASFRPWGKFWENTVTVRWAGCIKFDKQNRSQCLEVAYDFLKKGDIVGIFPEGYLHEYDKNKKPRTGLARLALKAKVPIIPVGMVSNITIRNDQTVLYQTRKALKNMIFNPHSLEINFGKPFELVEYYGQETNIELLRAATNSIMNKINDLSKINNVNGNH